MSCPSLSVQTSEPAYINPMAVQICYRDTNPYYIGVGSSSAPPSVIQLFTKLARRFADMGLHLRTQAVTDSNRAFFKGANQACATSRVFVPWLDAGQRNNPVFVPPSNDAYSNVRRKTINHQKLHKSQLDIRACTESLIFGQDTETPAKFIICWSPDGAENFRQITSQTGEIKMLLDLKPHWYMPVFNFQRQDAMERLSMYISDLKEELSSTTPTHSITQPEIDQILLTYKDIGVKRVLV